MHTLNLIMIWYCSIWYSKSHNNMILSILDYPSPSWFSFWIFPKGQILMEILSIFINLVSSLCLIDVRLLITHPTHLIVLDGGNILHLIHQRILQPDFIFIFMFPTFHLKMRKISFGNETEPTLEYS